MFACSGTNDLAFSLELPGTPQGLALTPEGHLAVTHLDEGDLPRLSVFNRNSGNVVFSHPAGTGAPVVGDGRVYVLTRTGVRAFRGVQVDWEIESFDDLVPGDSAIALTQDGIVVYGTQRGSLGTLHGVTHLGFPSWDAPIGGVPRGAPVTDRGDVVYVWTFLEEGDEGELVAVEGSTGTILWRLAGGFHPLAALDDGLIVSTDAGVARMASSGALAWEQPWPATAATLAGDGTVWISGVEGTRRVDLSTGGAVATLPSSCGPVVVDLLGTAWGLCDDATGGAVELTSLSNQARSESVPIASGTAVDAPIILDAVVYMLVDAPRPRLLGFVEGITASGASWSRATGSTGNDRRMYP